MPGWEQGQDPRVARSQCHPHIPQGLSMDASKKVDLKIIIIGALG